MNPPLRPQPRNARGGRRPGAMPAYGARKNQIIALGVVVLALVLLVRACAGRENGFEHTAHEFTRAVAANDYTAATKVQDAQSAAEMTRGRLRHAADQLAPLGNIRHVKENTPFTEPPSVHDFTVTFEYGTVHALIQFDSADKIVGFHFDPPVKT